MERTKRHKMLDIIFITMAAVISGAETWNEIEEYGDSSEPFLREYLELPNGIPRHDTFNRLFAALDPLLLEKVFLDWVKDVCKLTKGELINIDGKALRGSSKRGSKSMVHMVSAWSSANQLSLGQCKVDGKSNEITAIPKLLEALTLEGCTVTLDAMGCQTEIAKAIIDKDADYILATKGNQGTLMEQLIDTFQFAPVTNRYKHIDMGHGRIETRTCEVSSDLSHIEKLDKWVGLRTLIRTTSLRHIKSTGKEQSEIRYYISSLPPDAEHIGKAIRGHWAIENQLHWSLDVSFREDKSKKSTGNAPQNFSLLNKMALGLFKKDKQTKISIKRKRLKAAWNKNYMIKILNI